MISSARYRASRAALSTARHLLPPDGSITGLVEAVAIQRGRPIDVIPAHLGARPTAGFWVEGHEQDYIVYAAAAAPSQRDLAICHQLAHVLLGHGADPASPLAPGATPTGGRTMYPALHGYGEAQELQASRFARTIAAAASARDRRQGTHMMGRHPQGSGQSHPQTSPSS